MEGSPNEMYLTKKSTSDEGIRDSPCGMRTPFFKLRENFIPNGLNAKSICTTSKDTSRVKENQAQVNDN